MTPDSYTNQELMLEVGDGHQIYVHDWGKADANTPMLYLHGGPGNGCDDSDKNRFDPTTQRVIFHDQRSSGKSIPFGSLENNTTDKLIQDINKILEQLEIEQCIVVGGSWGATLALLYGIAEPGKVTGMVIDGVFTVTHAEHAWLEGGGWRTFFPDLWQLYTEGVPAEHRDDPSAYHFKHALGHDPEAAKRSIYAYLSVELALLKLDDTYTPGPYETFDVANGQIEMHYLANRCFIDENFILDNAGKLTMPVYIIAGRYDMVCPPEASYTLDQKLPNSKLIWTIGGHIKQHEAKTVQRLLLEQLNGAA